MRRERLDELEFVLVTREEQTALVEAWTRLGGTVDTDEGENTGISLFYVEQSVVLRTRRDRDN